MEIKLIYSAGGTLSFYCTYGVDETLKMASDLTAQGCIVLGFVIVEEANARHGYVDVTLNTHDLFVERMRAEQTLVDGTNYLITYYYYSDENLVHCVDTCLSKEDIITNIENEKYVEGADYYSKSQLHQIHELLFMRD